MPRRADGAPQPGWNWGPFTARLPLLHSRPEIPELLQGLLVANATGLAITPLYAEHFGMAFEVAVALVVVQAVLIASAFLLFGDPYCPGWLTPALPLVLREALLFETPGERVDFVNAVVLTVGLVFLLFGMTGLGRVFLRAVPPLMKSAIILGAGLSAIHGEFIPRSGGAPSRMEAYTVSILCAAGATLLLLFSVPLEPLKRRLRPVRALASLGIAPGFVLAMLVGPWVGEVSFESFRSYSGSTLFAPDFGVLLRDFSVLGRGLPDPAMFLRALPLALIAYVIGFGDIITGRAIVEDAARERTDETILFDERRTHLQVGLRNGLMGLFGGPFFPLQGPLWAGATVVVAERYRRGRDEMDSLWGGVSSYYFFGVPFFYFIRPVLELLRPVLAVAFSLTLLLTGFACGYISMAMTRDRVERGVALLTAMTIMYYSTLPGLLVGFALTIGLLGRRAWSE